MQPYRGKHSGPQVKQPTIVHVPEPVSEIPAVVPQKAARFHPLPLIIFLILVIFLLIGFLSPHFPETEQTEWVCDDLSATQDHIRIVFVSDIHYGFYFSESQLDKLFSQITSMRPDIVIFGGDYGNDIESSIAFFNKLAEKKLHARYKILGILGDTDTDHTDAQNNRLSDAMENASVIPLLNSVYKVDINGGSILVAGVDDPTSGSPDVKTVASKVKQSDFVIFLAHSPSILQEAQQAVDSSGKLNWFDLALFGHTHGGQIPFMGDSFGLTYGIDKHYHTGWLDENKVPILISNGLGTVRLPFRFFTPAQIHQIDLLTK